MIKLDVCPFCGGKTLQYRCEAIHCPEYGASGPDTNEGEIQAALYWNCRNEEKLKWTKTRPKKPGFYFYKRRAIQVVKIEWWGSETDEPWLNCVSIGQPVDYLVGQWAGPIPEPVE